MILFLETDSRTLSSFSADGTDTSGDIAFSTEHFFAPLDLALDTLESSLGPVSRYQSPTRSAVIPVSPFLWSHILYTNITKGLYFGTQLYSMNVDHVINGMLHVCFSCF